MKSFPFFKQYDAMDCGPTCIQMIAKYYNREYSLDYLRAECYITRMGVSMHGISEAAEKIGLRTLAVDVDLNKLVYHKPFPCILHWNRNHFVVLHKVSQPVWPGVRKLYGNEAETTFHIADPAHGLRQIQKSEFIKFWEHGGNQGVALLIEPTETFYKSDGEAQIGSKGGFHFLLPYIKRYKAAIMQLLLCMLAGSLISLILPFLTQSMVDKGINYGNIGFVKIVLISQLVLFMGSIAIDLIRAWLLIHINTRINVSIISDFLGKLMRLPLKYFDTKLIGDIKQRINDHNRIQTFLTGQALSMLFSSINLIVFSIVLCIYSLKIFAVFLVFSTIGICWILLFMRKRKEFDYIRFQRMGENENVVFELITGMQEIKLNNSERIKRWNWERIQIKLFDINIKSLALGQYQQVGSGFFNQLKNIIISFIAAIEVIHGNMTLGMMMSISYIIGQLNSPVQQLLGFAQSAQDARISLDRLNEIHSREDEERPLQQSLLQAADKTYIPDADPGTVESPATEQYGDIVLKDVSFQYGGQLSPMVLKSIDLIIPHGKVTAIVGNSGSGKTTLVKLLLNFYTPTKGIITIGDADLRNTSPASWRRECGIVLQDGYIFSDTIASNISMQDEDHINKEKLSHAAYVSNITEFIDGLPLNYNTAIGNSGIGISAGQRQRILIARAVYKDPGYLFFDEATSALDANNEKVIINNLEAFYRGKTVVVIAHRLSTVKHADQIVVLKDGEIAETGNHQSLLGRKGAYYQLVKNQLEL